MKFSDLKFVRLTQPEQFSLVPRYLFEQVKRKDWDVEDLYKYGPAFMEGIFNFFYVLAERKQIEEGCAPVKGILWTTIDPVTRIMCVNIFSIDKEYQKPQGQALVGALEHLSKVKNELRASGTMDLRDKILWATARPKAFMNKRIGAKRYYRQIMEVELS